MNTIDKISESSSGETNCGEEKTHEMYINVPSTPTTTLPECGSIIDIKYDLKVFPVRLKKIHFLKLCYIFIIILQVTASITGMYDNLSCTIPIMIGTVPLISNLSVPENSQFSISCTPKETPKCSNNGSINYHK